MFAFECECEGPEAPCRSPGKTLCKWRYPSVQSPVGTPRILYKIHTQIYRHRETCTYIHMLLPASWHASKLACFIMAWSSPGQFGCTVLCKDTLFIHIKQLYLCQFSFYFSWALLLFICKLSLSRKPESLPWISQLNGAMNNMEDTTDYIEQT